jgi:uncharacterized protein YfcZ (UPF0381/DUF406 family)
MPDECASDPGLNARKEIIRSLREIADRIEFEISDRFSQLRELESRFGFSCNSESVVSQLSSKS